MTTAKTASLLYLCCMPVLGACDSDEMMDPSGGDPEPTSFQIRIENIAPWTLLKSGIQSVKVGGTSAGPLGSGDAFEVTFTAGKGQAISFATMLGESNDWFFAPGPGGLALYDEAGLPREGDVTGEIALWDAGTEVNQEPGVGDAAGPNQSAPDLGAPDADDTVRELGETITLGDGSNFVLPPIAEMIEVTLTPATGGHFTLRVADVSTMVTLETSAGTREIHLSPVVWALHVRPAPLFQPGEPDRGQGLEAVAESGRGADLVAALGQLTGVATPISPGVYVVHAAVEPIFSLGTAERGQGLERIAEDGQPTMLGDTMAAGLPGVDASGIFGTPTGTYGESPAVPGASFELTVTALPGDRLSFATMFGMSNDWFFASRPGGIPLFDASGRPVSGDVTDDVGLFDAGTELDQELAIGADTAPQQPAPDTGPADPIAQVREVSAASYGHGAAEHVRVTITPAP